MAVTVSPAFSACVPVRPVAPVSAIEVMLTNCTSTVTSSVAV